MDKALAYCLVSLLGLKYHMQLIALAWGRLRCRRSSLQPLWTCWLPSLMEVVVPMP